MYSGNELDLTTVDMNERERRWDKVERDEEKKREARKIAWGGVTSARNHTAS